VRPPRERPIAWLSAPFSACCRAMRLGGGAIDDVNVVRAQFHQGAEQALPPSAHRPAMEPIVNRDRRPGAKSGRSPLETDTVVLPPLPIPWVIGVDPQSYLTRLPT
jgi:hypothetical protein